MQAKNINGEVRLSIADFQQLVEESNESSKAAELKKESISRLGDFLQFLKTKQYFDDLVEEFNGSHNILEIYIDESDGRAKIKRKDE